MTTLANRILWFLGFALVIAALVLFWIGNLPRALEAMCFSLLSLYLAQALALWPGRLVIKAE